MTNYSIQAAGGVGHDAAQTANVVDNLANFSVSIWINPNSTPGIDQCFVTKAANLFAGENGWVLDLNPSFQIRFIFQGPGGTIERDSSITLSSGNWYNIIATKDSSFNLHLYVNGVLQDGTLSGTAPSSFSNTDGLRMAAGSGSGSQDFGGFYTALQVWNRVLSSGEISTFYATGTTPNTPLYSWRMQEGSGGSINDDENDGNIFTHLIGGPFTWSSNVPSPFPTNPVLMLNLSDSFTLSESLTFRGGAIFSESTSTSEQFAIQMQFSSASTPPVFEVLTNKLIPADVKVYYNIQE